MVFAHHDIRAYYRGRSLPRMVSETLKTDKNAADYVRDSLLVELKLLLMFEPIIFNTASRGKGVVPQLFAEISVGVTK